MPQQPIDADVADWLDESDWTPKTVEKAVSSLNQWCRWLAARDPAVAILAADHRHLRGYLEERRDAGIAPATRHKNWQAITGFYRWAATSTRDGGAGLLADNPMQRVKPPHVPSKPSTRAAKPDEIVRLEDYFESIARERRGGGEHERARRNLVMVSLMFRSGCRSGELPWIDLVDVDTSRGDGRWVIRLWGDHTKSGEPRLVPVQPQTERYLKRYLRVRGSHAGPLFAGRAAHTRAVDGRLQAAAVQRMVVRAARRVGVPVSAHQLRRGWVAEQFRAGGDTTMVQVIGGWNDPRMPNRYLADERDRVALERFWDLHEQPPSRKLRSV